MKNNMRRAMADCIYMAYVVRGEKIDTSAPATAPVAESSFPI
jgi:hypothetical protein